MAELSADPTVNLSFPVVGIGASAGGLEALDELLQAMPPKTGMAFVVVTHQHPGHASMLPELLNRETEMPVVEAANQQTIQPNHVYVGSPGFYLAILDGKLQRLKMEEQDSPHFPIDSFFRSLAEHHKERAICIILSGTGTDGTLGLKAIKEESGMAMVEKPQAAKYAGMPSSAIATGLVDYVLSPHEMPDQLVDYASGPYLNCPEVTAETIVVPAEPMQKIFMLLRRRAGNDFSLYKSNTLRRRIERRMNVHRIDKPDQYVRYLESNPHEIDLLFKELLISVTNFFRDPAAWESLAKPLREMVQSDSEKDGFRAWAPGCATGEEVYSLAITIRQALDAANKYREVQIFGTDLDADAIETARYGVYSDGIAVDVPRDPLERFFIHENGEYRVRQEIREMAVFATQNLINDPPFTKLNLISCRNLLIYLNSDVQKKLFPIFHYALKPDGLLFLGPSETIGMFSDLFEPIDKRWKIYRRKESPTGIHLLPEIPAQTPTDPTDRFRMAPARTQQKQIQVSSLIEKLLLSRFTPVSVVVNDHGEIIYIHGRTGMYLEPTPGQPRSNLLEMAREGLQIELASAMRQCRTTDKEVVHNKVRVKTNGDFTHVDLSVVKLASPETLRGLLLVTFRSSEPPAEQGTQSSSLQSGKDDKEVNHLEQELQFMRESHQTTLEELETSNEELKSTNEELQSTNEELQSTNEEVETSKEEMQSLNEELTTVNAELQSKVEDLSQSNDDMQNLLNSTDIATIFLDDHLNIKRYTQKASELVMLRATDVGRPISELASNLDYNELSTDCRSVLKTLAFREREVRTKAGGWYLMRIMPYRTNENVIEGLVITFVDIGQLKAAQESSRLQGFFESVIETVRQPLVVLDSTRQIVLANRCFCDTLGVRKEEVLGKPLAEIGEQQWNSPQLADLLEQILAQNTTLSDYKVEYDSPDGDRKVVLFSARRLEQELGLPGMILVAVEDITPR